MQPLLFNTATRRGGWKSAWAFGPRNSTAAPRRGQGSGEVRRRETRLGQPLAAARPRGRSGVMGPLRLRPRLGAMPGDDQGQVPAVGQAGAVGPGRVHRVGARAAVLVLDGERLEAGVALLRLAAVAPVD